MAAASGGSFVKSCVCSSSERREIARAASVDGQIFDEFGELFRTCRDDLFFKCLLRIKFV